MVSLVSLVTMLCMDAVSSLEAEPRIIHSNALHWNERIQAVIKVKWYYLMFVNDTPNHPAKLFFCVGERLSTSLI
jgi:hypothetical protein